MKLDNVRKLVADDFEEEQSELIDGIGSVINPFMTNVSDILNGQVDYDNLKQELVTISVKVDGSGVPTQSTTIGTSKLKSIQGLVVVQVRNSSSASSGLTAAPFIDYIVNSSTNLKVNKIFGLAAGIQYQIKVLLIG